MHVYLAHNGNDLNPVLVNGSTQEHVNLKGFNKANLNGTEYNISYLQQPAANLQHIGIMAKLITGKNAGIDSIQSTALIADASQVTSNYLTSDAIIKQIGSLNNHDLAALLVKNGLGSTDAGTIQFVEDFLKTHKLSELVGLAVKNQAVIDYAFGAEGLQLI